MNILQELDTRPLIVLDTVELADGTLVQITQSSDIEEDHTGVVFKRPGAKEWQFGAYVEISSVALSTTADRTKAMFITSPIPVIFDPNKECPPDEVHLLETTDFSNGQGVALKFVADVDGTTYCGGTQGQILRLTDRVDEKGSLQWDNISPAIEEGQPKPIFSALTGFGDDDLYAFDYDGCIWHWDGAEWSQKDSPTDYILTKACAHREEVYACGVGGMLIRGRGNDWKVVSHDGAPSGNMFAVGGFGDSAFCSNEYGQAYKITDDKVEDCEELWGTTSLCSGPSGLWSSGRGGTHLVNEEGCTTVVERPDQDED